VGVVGKGSVNRWLEQRQCIEIQGGATGRGKAVKSRGHKRFFGDESCEI